MTKSYSSQDKDIVSSIGRLFCREEAIISVFENNTNAVVNVFDVTLQVEGSSPLQALIANDDASA